MMSHSLGNYFSEIFLEGDWNLKKRKKIWFIFLPKFFILKLKLNWKFWMISLARLLSEIYFFLTNFSQKKIRKQIFIFKKLISAYFQQWSEFISCSKKSQKIRFFQNAFFCKFGRIWKLEMYCIYQFNLVPFIFNKKKYLIFMKRISLPLSTYSSAFPIILSFLPFETYRISKKFFSYLFFLCIKQFKHHFADLFPHTKKSIW